MKKPPSPTPGGEGWLYGIGAVFFGGAIIGGFISAWEAGREYGFREALKREREKEQKEHGR